MRKISKISKGFDLNFPYLYFIGSTEKVICNCRTVSTTTNYIFVNFISPKNTIVNYTNTRFLRKIYREQNLPDYTIKRARVRKL